MCCDGLVLRVVCFACQKLERRGEETESGLKARVAAVEQRELDAIRQGEEAARRVEDANRRQEEVKAAEEVRVCLGMAHDGV